MTIGLLRSLIERRLRSLQGTAEPAVLAFLLAVEGRYRTEPSVTVLSAWLEMLRAARKLR